MPENESKTKTVSLGRHKRSCSICPHPNRAEIEAEFVAWRSPAALAQQYGLADRVSVYRHAHALGLFDKRRRNLRAALERIIEKAGEVEVTVPQACLLRLFHVSLTQYAKQSTMLSSF